MITFFRYFPTEYVRIPLNNSAGQIKACKVDMNGIKHYRIDDKWWKEDSLGKMKKSRNTPEEVQ
jgi:hypothetical protein